MSRPSPALAVRRRLALARLLFLYILTCALLLLVAVLVDRSRQLGNGGPLPPAEAPGLQIPPLGVTVELGQYRSAVERRRALQQLGEAGFGWVRQRLDWGEIEPAPGAFSWAASDAILADIVAAGLIPVVVLDGSPAWARAPGDGDNPLAPPAQVETFARFAAAFAARYGPLVRFYQIWDEPNIAPHWGNRLVEPVAYARLLAAAAAAVRAADDDAVILLAALAPTADRGHTAIDEVYYLQRLYAAGAAPFFDVVAAQPFGFGTAADDARSRVDVLSFARVRLIRRAMVAAGDGETPIWAVRFGWNRAVNNTWRTVTAEAQIDYTGQALALARRWPWLATLGWAIDRPDAPAGDPRWGFALVTAAGEPTPLLAVFQQAPPAPVLPASPWRPVLAALLGLLLVGWRARAALALLPLAAWAAAYRALGRRRLGLWIALAVLYYFAAWPPWIGLCWLAAAALIRARPLDGLILAALLLPFHFQHKEIDLAVVTWAVPPAQALLLGLVPALAGQARRLRRFHLAPGDWLALAWLAISLPAAANVWHWPAYGGGLWSLVLVPLLFYGSARLLVVDAAGRRMVVLALGLGGALAAAIGLARWLDGGGVGVDGVRRLLGLTYSPNQTALYLLRSFFVLVGLALAGGRRCWLPALVVAVALILTGSRGALLLGLPAGGLFLFWQAGGLTGRRRFALAGGLALGTLLALAALFLWGERLLNSETVWRRFAIWQGALDLWRAYAWWGVGPGGFFWRYPATMAPAAAAEPNLLHAHNAWLNIATGWGVAGLLWLAALLAWFGNRCVRIRRQGDWLLAGLAAAVAAAFAHAQVDAFALLPELAAWNWLVFALLAGRPIQKSNAAEV